MFNPVIIVAIIIQAIVARRSRLEGAIVGYIITTGILLWGIFVYAQGNQITLIGIPLALPVFLIACLVWYAFDTREFMAARVANLQPKLDKSTASTSKPSSHGAPPWVANLIMLALGIIIGFVGHWLIAPGGTSGTSGSPFDMAVAKTRHFKGNSNAPVTLIEFSDFQ